jgi:hypothetical protein
MYSKRALKVINNNAKKLGVTIKKSSNKGKKFDVFDKQGNKIAAIGAKGYNDYHIYHDKMGKVYANKKRESYLARHKKDINNKNGAGFYAAKILWNRL